MDNSSEEAGVTSFFAGSVMSVMVADLTKDKEVVDSSHSPNPPIVLNFSVVVREGEECLRRGLGQLIRETGVGIDVQCVVEGDNEEETSFVDIIVDLDVGAGDAREGFTFADNSQWAGSLSKNIQKVPLILPNCHCVSL